MNLPWQPRRAGASHLHRKVWSRAASAARALAGWLLRPPLLGALYLLAVVAASTQGPLIDPEERVLGPDTGKLARLVHVEFASVISDVSIAIASAAVAVGALVGLLASVLIGARSRVLGQKRSHPLPRALRALVVVACLHALAMAWSMACWPQLYNRSWFRTEGIARDVVLFVTDAGPRVVAGTGALLALAYAAGLPGSLVNARTRAARAWRSLLRWARRPRSIALVGVALLLAAIVAGRDATRRPVRSPADPRPNVLIVALDSLRNDRLGTPVTPTLSALAARGVRFERAYSTLPRTFSSWATILTGRFPHHHGIRSMFARWENRARDLDALPSRLRGAGYRTAVVSDYAGDVFTLADFGFETIRAPTFDFREIIRRRAVARATPLLPFLNSRLGRLVMPALWSLSTVADPDLLSSVAVEELGRDDARPFFLTVFFSATHFPYAAQWPYYARYTDPDYPGPNKYLKDVSYEAERTNDADVRQTRALYDGAVASADAAVAAIVRALERLGLDRNTIVVITADHGEILFDHGRYQGHGTDLFGDEALHVPLVIVDPRDVEARKVSGIVRDVDLAPTLYELTRVEAPSTLDGRSLAPALRGVPLPRAYAFAESELWLSDSSDVPFDMRIPYPTMGELLEVDRRHGDQVVVRAEHEAITVIARHRSVRDERFKLVYVPLRTGARYLLFDTEADPAETQDVAESHPQQFERLHRALWEWMLSDEGMVRRDGLLVPAEAPVHAEALP